MLHCERRKRDRPPGWAGSPRKNEFDCRPRAIDPLQAAQVYFIVIVQRARPGRAVCSKNREQSEEEQPFGR